MLVEHPITQILGAWYVLATDDPFWRTNTHPRIDLVPIAGEAEHCREELRFRRDGLLGPARKLMVNTHARESSGRFRRLGSGLRRGGETWTILARGPERLWLVTARDRGRRGDRSTLEILSRDPWIPQARLDAILAALVAHPSRPSTAKLYAPKQDWRPPQPYSFASP